MNERLKELKSNQLADWLEAQLSKGAQYIKPILIGAVVLFVGAMVVLFINSQQEQRAAEGWEEFMQAGGDSTALLTVAEQHSGQPVGLWARTSRASSDLQSAASLMHSDRSRAKEQVESAIEDLEQVLQQTQGAGQPLVRSHALFAMGQAHELSFDVDSAIQSYEQLQAEGAEGSKTLVEMAKRRAEMLADPSMQDFYIWYAGQKPASRFPGSMMPPGSTPPVTDVDLPQDLSTLPSFPDLSVPKPAPVAPPTGSDGAAEPPAEAAQPPLEAPEPAPASDSEPAAEKSSTDDPKEAATDDPKEAATDDPKEAAADDEADPAKEESAKDESTASDEGV